MLTGNKNEIQRYKFVPFQIFKYNLFLHFYKQNNTYYPFRICFTGKKQRLIVSNEAEKKKLLKKIWSLG